MKRFYAVFTTVSCFVLIALNLYLNYRLYRLNETRSFAAMAEPSASETELAQADAALEENVAAVMADGTAQLGAANSATNDAPLYMLGVRDGFVAVFYGKAGNPVKEVTSFSVDAMPSDERLRLSMGIPVYSEEQLAMLLQDYGS